MHLELSVCFIKEIKVLKKQLKFALLIRNTVRCVWVCAHRKTSFHYKKNQKEIFSVLKDCFLFIFVLKEKKDPNASFLSSSIFWTNLTIALSSCLPPLKNCLRIKIRTKTNHVKKRMQHLNKTLLESNSVNSLQILFCKHSNSSYYLFLSDNVFDINYRNSEFLI